MRIRTQILLGYAYLVALLLAGALGAAVSFYELGHELDLLLTTARSTTRTTLENKFHKAAAQLLQGISAKSENAGSIETLAEFEEALRNERQKSHEAGESTVFEHMNSHLQQLHQALASPPPEGPGRRSPPGELFPIIENFEKDFQDLRDREERLILEGDRSLRRQTRIRTMAFSLLVIVAMLSLVLLSRELRRSLLSRLDDLRDLANEIRNGHSHRRAFVSTRDELGLLAEAINALLDSWDEERHEARGRALRRRRIILGLLGALDRPAVVVQPDGRILASTISRQEAEIERILKNPSKARDHGWEMQELRTAAGASVGSLLYLRDESKPEQ